MVEIIRRRQTPQLRSLQEGINLDQVGFSLFFKDQSFFTRVGLQVKIITKVFFENKFYYCSNRFYI